MENELLELVFEGLDDITARRLAEEIAGQPVALPSREIAVFDTEIPRLEIGARAALGRAHLRVLRYDVDVYDVEINFVLADAECSRATRLLKALHEFATRISEAHGIEVFYAGMEPAVDEDTRIFTGTERGPLFKGLRRTALRRGRSRGPG